MRAISGLGRWKPKERCDQPDLAVEGLEAAVGEAEADGGEDAVAAGAQGAGEPDEGLQSRA